MRAVRFHTFGGPGVLAIEDDVPETPAGPGRFASAWRPRA